MMNKSSRFLLRMIFILSVLFPVLNHAQFIPIQVTTNSARQIYPSVWGNRIVWQDERNKTSIIINYDTYMYTLPSGPEQRINTSSKDQSHPEIWENIIVWDDLRNGLRDIYMYDINTGEETRVTTDDEYQDYPDVSDSIIVWRDRRIGASWEYTVFMYDMYNGSEARVSADSGYMQEGPRISGHKIVWSQKVGSSYSIFFADLDSGFREQLTSDLYNQYAPDIHGDSVVWIEERNGAYSMYLEDLTTHTVHFLTNQVTAHSKPRISDKGIAWDVLVDLYGNQDLYFYEFATGAVVPIMTSGYSEEHPSLWSNRIVWDDASGGNDDIYYLDFVRPPGADLYVSPKDSPDPVLLNGYCTYTIKVGNYGFENAANVILSGTLSPKVEFYHASSDQGTCSYSSGTVTCNLGNIGFKDSVIVNIVAIARDTGYAYFSSSVSADEQDQITFNNTAAIKTRINSYTTDEVPFPRDIKDLSLDVDSYGTAHISCTSEGEFYPNNGTDIIYLTNKTGVWESYRIYNGTAHNYIFDGVGNPPYDLWDGENSMITVDESNYAHICYARHFTRTSVFGNLLEENYKLYYTNNVTGTWTTPVELIELPYIRPVSIKTDHNGRAHIAFITCPVAYTGSLYYFTNASGSWESEIIHSNIYDHASMTLDNDDKVHFSFYSWDITGSESPVQGLAYITGEYGNWSTPVHVDNVGGQMEGMTTSIVTDNLNNPHISYLGGQYGYNKYAYKSGGVWVLCDIDEGWGSGRTSIDLDNSGKAHILYQPLYGSEIFRYAQNISGIFEHCDMEEADHFQIKIDTDDKYHIVYNDIYLTNRSHSDQYGGGGDGSGGYYFVTSDEEAGSMPNQPSYEWIDPVTGSHSEITSWTSGDNDDGYFQAASLGMTFPFFGQDYDHVFISSNGYLSFANGHTDNAEYAFIPSSIQPNNFIAGCAMDLDCGHSGSHVYYYGAGSEFIVTYWHVYDKGSDSDYITFQIILYSNGNIKIQFNDSESVVPAPESINGNALVGIENHDGSEGLSYHNNGDGGPLFGSPLAVMFGSDPYILPVELSSFESVLSGSSVLLKWTTATELNNYGFEIQRKIKNVDIEKGVKAERLNNWMKIGFVKGSGNSNSTRNYSFTDNTIRNGITYFYRLKQIDNDGSIKFSEELQVNFDLPLDYFLAQNYPNPFNPATKIRYSVPYVGTHRDASVRINVYDVLGRKIATLVNKKQPPGNYEVTFDGSRFASGIYFYRIQAGSFSSVKKMILMK